jgi:hypothetical protein
VQQLLVKQKPVGFTVCERRPVALPRLLSTVRSIEVTARRRHRPIGGHP